MHWLKGKPDDEGRTSTNGHLIVWVDGVGLVSDVVYDSAEGFCKHTGPFQYEPLSNVTNYMYVSKPS